MKKRRVDIVVISDVHLGTYGCRAKELLWYLKSIKPKTVVLNGDIIDIWQFSKNYWPKSHMKVVRHMMGWVTKGVTMYYIPGNHDETLRKFAGMKVGSFRIVNKVVLEPEPGKKAWFFHGDVFDVTMQHGKWLAKMGAIGYDTLILINSFCNFISEKVFHKGKLSLSKKIKNSVKSAVKFIGNFEQVCTDMGIEHGYDYVVCGHIHQPEMRTVTNAQGSIMYLNSGDWIENLTALEYNNGAWSIYKYNEAELDKESEETDDIGDLNNSEIFNQLVKEFSIN